MRNPAGAHVSSVPVITLLLVAAVAGTACTASSVGPGFGTTDTDAGADAGPDVQELPSDGSGFREGASADAPSPTTDGAQLGSESSAEGGAGNLLPGDSTLTL